jgi:hypothetical protein
MIRAAYTPVRIGPVFLKGKEILEDLMVEGDIKVMGCKHVDGFF